MMKLKPVERQPDPPAPTLHTDVVRVSDVRGLIDNATPDRLYGWAFDAAAPQHRLKVELRLAGEPVAETVADFVRPDLAKHGVGDGCHAFEFALLPEWFERRGELVAVAFGADGREFPIRVRRPEEGQLTQTHRAMEAMAQDQQALRRDLATFQERVAMLADASAVEALGRAQAEMGQRLDQMELWLTRLDARLAETAQPEERAGGHGLDLWQAALYAILASALSAAFAIAAANWIG